MGWHQRSSKIEQYYKPIPNYKRIKIYSLLTEGIEEVVVSTEVTVEAFCTEVTIEAFCTEVTVEAFSTEVTVEDLKEFQILV